jgi:predicted RND superfamily exporter protein
VGSLVAATVRWAHRRRLIVAAAVAGAVIISLEGTRRLSFDADVLSLLPRDSRVIQSFRTFLARFGSLDQLSVRRLHRA